MENSQVQWMLQQGIGVAFAAAMFFIYRKDSMLWAQKQSETAAAFMAFGEKYAAAATAQSMALQRQAEILDRIERQMATSKVA